MPNDERVNVETFVKVCIENLRDSTKSTGIHAVYSGFNSAFKEYYGEGADPIAAIDALAEQGKVVKQFRRGGPMLYLPGEEPVRVDNSGKAALKKAGLVK